MDAIIDQTALPSDDLAGAWTAIKIAEDVRQRLLAQALLSLQLRQRFAFEVMPIHGLILLSGAPGTGKTTLARGLANKVAEALPGQKSRFIQIDPHALASSSLGRSQKEVTKLFHEAIPEYAAHGPCLVLLDEVETLAADRQQMSLEANPIDVHRATDAALSGIDLLAPHHRNVLLIATTNFPRAVDRALLSRADWIEDIGLPGPEARAEIITDSLERLATQWPRVADLKANVGAFVAASAFAVGALLNVKSGKKIEIEQRGTADRRFWSLDDDPVNHEPPFTFEDELTPRGGDEVALAVGLTHDVSPAVRTFVGTSLSQVGRIIHCKPAGGPSYHSVQGGRHAWMLSESVVRRLTALRGQGERASPVHVFIAGPNAFTFFLGQQQQAIGPTVLYEWDFDGHRGGGYSLGLSVGQAQRQ